MLAGGWNGPEGWKWIDNDKKFPLPGSHPYALLYRLVKLEQETRPAPFIGSVLVWVPVKSWTLLGAPLEFGWSGDTVRLQFRTNDDSPGNGEGAFRCDVLVACTQP